MSLYKQLWLVVICLMIVIFGGTFIVSSLSAKAYLEQQLYMKNSDNATALALSLTQQNADPVLLELTLSAQFDTGHYELIQLTDPEGNITIIRQDPQIDLDAPRWFSRLFPIEVQAGVAQVQQGWQQLGTLTLRSHARFAYRELWHNTQKQALIFLVAMLIAGLLGSYILKIILRPLNDIVGQAEAIGERRFITIAEPGTREFKAVAQSMNMLSKRIKSMLNAEAIRLEKWRRETQVDPITGLEVRDSFMQLLTSATERDDAGASGVITLIRVIDLARLNQRHGRKTTDNLLAGLGNALTKLGDKSDGWTAGRLNGSDFAVLAPRAVDPAQVGREMQQAMREVLKIKGLDEEVRLPGASGTFQQGDNCSTLLTNIDAALLASDSQGESLIGVVSHAETQILPVKNNAGAWLEIFEAGFKDKAFSLASFPVSKLGGELIHMEALARLTVGKELLSAGQFLPWINRLDLASDLDKRVVKLALAQIQATEKPVCINLSFAALTDPGFLPWLSDQLSSRAESARQLSMEVQEAMAYRHLEAFKKLCIRVKLYDSKIGMEHVGHQLSEIGKLHDVGLDYIKIDAALVREINQNVANQTLLTTLSTLGHSLGMMVLAEGVQSEQEWLALANLGIDGATGPEVTRREKQA